MPCRLPVCRLFKKSRFLLLFCSIPWDGAIFIRLEAISKIFMLLNKLKYIPKFMRTLFRLDAKAFENMEN
jgi:hypothetical protein